VYASGQSIIFLETPVVLTDPLTQQERTVYVNMSYHRLHTEAGDPQGMLGFATDVTPQVLAQRERDTQREQLQAVFAQAPVAVCVFRGEDPVFDVVNPSMAEMLGHPLAALVGRPFSEVLPELHSQGLPALLAEVRRTGTPFVAQEQQIQLARHRPGEPGYFNYVYQPLLVPTPAGRRRPSDGHRVGGHRRHRAGARPRAGGAAQPGA
jgi:PAS domain S-box-containing protein